MVHEEGEGVYRCKSCKSRHVDLVEDDGEQLWICLDCGAEHFE